MADQQQQSPTAEAEEQKCWAAVLESPTDFATWQQLLVASEKTNDLAHVRNAYNAFLEAFPLCYVYWNKFALHESERGADAALDVYERAVHALPHSVDLWVYYVSYALEHCSDVDKTKQLFERAVDAVGLDFAAQPVWDKYLEFENARENFREVNALFIRVLSTPLEALAQFWDKYKLFVSSRQLSEILTDAEQHDWESKQRELHAQLEEKRAEKRRQQAATGKMADLEDEKSWIFPELKTEGDIEVEVRSKALESREKLFKDTLEEAEKRRAFESIAQRRSYFHVNPVAEPLLANWRAYLKFEEGLGDRKRIVKLYERCLVACCYYIEFWHMYTSFLEVSGLLDEAREVYERATGVFVKQRPELFLSYAIFEETHGNLDNAEKIYQSLVSRFPGHIEVVLRCVAFWRRRGNSKTADEIYATALQHLKGRPHAYLCLHYARFLDRTMGDAERARAMYNDALRLHTDCREVWQAAIAFEEAQRGPEAESRVTRLYEYATQESSALGPADKQDLRLAWLEYVADYGTDFATWRKLERDVLSNATLKRDALAAGIGAPGMPPAKMARPDMPGAFPYGQWPAPAAYPQFPQFAGAWGGYQQPGATSPK
eukprot:m51a1_g1515 hypothetical protein (604) ;mRNA; r:422144-425408